MFVEINKKAAINRALLDEDVKALDMNTLSIKEIGDLKLSELQDYKYFVKEYEAVKSEATENEEEVDIPITIIPTQPEAEEIEQKKQIKQIKAEVKKPRKMQENKSSIDMGKVFALRAAGMGRKDLAIEFGIKTQALSDKVYRFKQRYEKIILDNLSNGKSLAEVAELTGLTEVTIKNVHVEAVKKRGRADE